MKRILTKNVLTLLAVIVTIAVLHLLQSFQKKNTGKTPVEAAVVKKTLAG
ncbi:MAG: hypothetical protein IT249_17360 [Chitinophagaceae bacterium]|nr:hypothetical protein [Chitinophagaceae bacterium]